MTPSLGEVLTAFLERRGAGQGSKGALAVLRWPELVGRAVAANARALHVKRGVLTVSVTSSVWATELSMRIPALLDKISEALGPGVVKDIRFVTWQPDAPKLGGANRAYGSRGRGAGTRTPGGATGAPGEAAWTPGAGAHGAFGPDRRDLAAVNLDAQDQELVRSAAAQAKDPELSGALRRWLTLTLKAKRWAGGRGSRM